MEERCKGCKFARTINATGGWSFVGCMYEPYKGKWVAEIKDCPKVEIKEGIERASKDYLDMSMGGE